MILGITGTIGAGKGEVVEYLVRQKGFKHFSVRDLLVEEITRRRLPATRDTMRLVANEMRKTKNPSYIIESLYARAKEYGGNAIIESVRALAEAEYLRKQGVLILAVDADRKLRYDRIVLRGSSTDKVDFDTWVAQEDRELSAKDPWDMNILGVMEKADYKIQNDDSINDLHSQVGEMLTQIKK